MVNSFMRFADNRNPNSMACRLRAKRLEWLYGLARPFRAPVRILDVGGTESFWHGLDRRRIGDCDITILNRTAPTVPAVGDGFTAVAGDARDMAEFSDCQFDIVFSNSVIEHVGDKHDRERMAQEVRRVGKSYMVQTPNLYFPIEPHFLVPFFQFLPVRARAEMLTRWNLGWCPRARGLDEALEVVRSVDLIDRHEMQELFPDARIETERIFGLPKSLIALRSLS